MPIRSPPCTSARSSAGSPSIVSRSFSSAGLPASSLITCPSAAVMVSSGPIGPAPPPLLNPPAAREKGGPPPAGAARRGPADQRHRRDGLRQEAQHRVGGER